VFNITLGSLRQRMTPDALQGRVNATSRVMAGAAAPVGALLGGALGDEIGLRATLVVGGLGIALAGLWIVMSPVRGMQHSPARVSGPGDC
jgi:predicted MFS family arabinose efflux permease